MDEFISVIKNFGTKEISSTVCALCAWAWTNLSGAWAHWLTPSMVVISTCLGFVILLLNFLISWHRNKDVQAAHVKMLIELERAKVELKISKAKWEKICDDSTK